MKQRFYTPWKNGTLEAPYFYIPATVKDNPHLPQAYLDSLELLPERDYKVYVQGSWDELAGAALEELHEKIHLVPRPLLIPDHWMRFGAFDWGYKHPFVFGLFVASSEATFLVETISGRGMADANMIHYVKEVAHSVNFPISELEYTVAGRDAFHDVQARANIGETTAERFMQAGIPMIPADTSRISGLKNMREMTAWQKRGPNGTQGFPAFKMFDTPSNRTTFEQLQNMVLDPDRPEDVLKVDASDDGTGGDDRYDMLRYGLQSRATAHAAPAPEVGEDVHPGFDYKQKRRQVARQTITDPLATMFEDDLRPNLYRMPRMAGGGSLWRMPRPSDEEEYSDDL